MASIRLKLYSASLKTRTNVNVLLPTLLPDQNGATTRGQEFTEFYNTHGNYPVLYLLHGTFGDEGDWQRYSRIEDYARTRNVVVVMPYGENSCYRDTKSGKNYETYITQELPKDHPMDVSCFQTERGHLYLRSFHGRRRGCPPGCLIRTFMAILQDYRQISVPLQKRSETVILQSGHLLTME